MKKVYFIPIIFAITLAICFTILYVIHINLKGYLLENFLNLLYKKFSCAKIFFPTHLEDLKILCDSLLKCYDDHQLQIHIFHALCFVFLQTWCVPGTVFFNLFGGAVFGVYKGTIICLIVKFNFYKILKFSAKCYWSYLVIHNV
jgi:hypothetical protein